MNDYFTFLFLCIKFKLEKSKFYIQQLEADVIKCREQIARSEEEFRSTQRELKQLHMESDDERDALVNEVRELNKKIKGASR